MIRTRIKQITVVRDKDKALLRCEILTNILSCLRIEVIGRLIDQQKVILTGKQNCKQYLCTLSETERFKRTIQHLSIFVKLRQFAYHAPLFAIFPQLLGKICRCLFHLLRCYQIRKIGNRDGLCKSSASRKLTCKQSEKCCFSFSVSADKSEFPICIKCKGCVFKYRLYRTIIAECKAVGSDL